jgi:hypothetical protein
MIFIEELSATQANRFPHAEDLAYAILHDSGGHTFYRPSVKPEPRTENRQPETGNRPPGCGRPRPLALGAARPEPVGRGGTRS